MPVLRLIFFILVGAVCGCAAPRFDAQVGVVAPKELKAVSLAQEGMNFYRAGRMPDAELKFRQALWLYPGTDNILYNLALSLVKQGSFAEAQAIYAGLLKRNPDSTTLLADIAEGYFLAAAYPQAEEQLKRAFTIAESAGRSGEVARLARSLAVLNFNSGDEQDALCYSYEAAGISGSEEDLFKHVRMLIALNLNRQALAALEAAEAGAEKRADPRRLYYLALAGYGLGRFADVVEQCDTALAATARDAGLQQDFRILKSYAVAAASGAQAAAGQAGLSQEEAAELEVYVQQLLSSPARLLFLPPRLLEDLKKGKPQ